MFIFDIGRKNIERTCNVTFVERMLYLLRFDDECDLGIHFHSNWQFSRHMNAICV